MNPEENQLWNRIQLFKIDNENDSFQFSDRLVRENGWTKSYALRVIEEYKRFIFLSCISKQELTPSDAVDQVWHLHLTYTKSYWKDFCGNTLGREFHHHPTKGGKQQAKKFESCYSNLRTRYINTFLENPPLDIWFHTKDRFSDIHFQRVNLSKNWIVPKPSVHFKPYFLGFLMILVGLISIQATNILIPIIVAVFVLFGLFFLAFKYKGKGDESGCYNTSGCSVIASSDHHSDSTNDFEIGDSTDGDSGCSSDGCSGCGGGD